MPEMNVSQKFVDWWTDRLHLKDIPLARIPDYMYSVNYWLGSMVAAALIWEVVTGLFLILYYVPSDPYGGITYLVDSVPFGSLLIATHLYGAYAMILLAYIHMFRNYFVKAYKKPRELQWMIGVILLTIVQGAAFLGYSMTGDVLAADAVDVGRGIMGDFPLGLGKALEPFIFGNGTSIDLFTRLLGYHIILVALIGLLFLFHFYLAEMNGFMPHPSRVGYKVPALLDEKDPSLNPWYPRNLLYMVELSLFTFSGIVLVPSVISLIPHVPILFSPYPSVSPTSPLATTIPAYPPWFFLFMYKVLDFQPLSAFDVTLIAAILPILYFLFVPILDRSHDLHFFKGWIFQAIGVIAIVNFIQASVWAALAPGVPVTPSVYIPIIGEPFAVVLIGFYIISKRKNMDSGAGPSTHLETSSLVALVFIAALAVGLYMVASQAVNHLLTIPSLEGVPPMISGLLATGVLSVLLIRYDDIIRVNSKTRRSMRQTTPSPARKVNRKLGTAYIILTLLVATSIADAVVMWLLNPVSQAAFFGLGLGALLLMFAEMISVYHYVAYSRR
jgi:quinol-cytochrome oxidoreductase complex cytochrome b subunit